jgi:hypothetical protein
VPEERLAVLGAVAARWEKFLDERVDEILSICKVIGAYPVLVTEKNEPSAKDILCIHLDELSKMRSAEELVARL